MSSILQPVIDISSICVKLGLREAVISPGSRSAPLTLSFARQKEIKTTVVPDERSAAFVALGMAQASKRPTALICTSGSAAYNYAPAVAEAYFQQVPLLVLTADRPPEWIDQYDGQTIRQSGIYGKHVKKSFELPVDFSHPDAHWHCERMVSEAVNLSKSFPAGPVHINVPLREPFYPRANEPYEFRQNLQVIEEWQGSRQLDESHWKQLFQEIDDYQRVVIVAGQQEANHQLRTMVEALSTSRNIPVLADVISNMHGVTGSIKRHDAFLNPANRQLFDKLKPDLVISFGKSVISKNLKLFLRQYKPKAHWHLKSADFLSDPFQSLTRVLDCSAHQFFSRLVNHYMKPKAFTYYQQWEMAERETVRANAAYLTDVRFGEFFVVRQLMQELQGSNARLHLANSMAVRYANYAGLSEAQKGVAVFANRGTSGIDGCTSTAIGHARMTDEPVLLMTGDIALFYDRNGFWQDNIPSNLRILLLNNHAGGIFRMIKGPAEQPELEQYFETTHHHNAKLTCKEFGLDYINCQDNDDLERVLPSFLESGSRPRLLEIEVDSAHNAEIFQGYKDAVLHSVGDRATKIGSTS